MKKLEFSADPQQLTALGSGSASLNTQNYVVDLLSQQLQQQGFVTAREHASDQFEVSLTQPEVSFQINCQPDQASGRMSCQITLLHAEDQDWFDKITGQSVLRQLKYAMENSLKLQSAFSAFEWKN
ncbi:hypothetical protein [Acinetobacter larvae]|uniref:Uncharacterized protein n=1 Tax=Acinetobacter larvae TaxID=1789224 RepID=A0A1B2M4F5_9GAMM|nr:hypothetical protein [Acinetobacter larvae]AOA59963.1 hypothetical protein BFG52_10300 [Acinetobacter larvae]